LCWRDRPGRPVRPGYVTLSVSARLCCLRFLHFPQGLLDRQWLCLAFGLDSPVSGPPWPLFPSLSTISHVLRCQACVHCAAFASAAETLLWVVSSTCIRIRAGPARFFIAFNSGGKDTARCLFGERDRCWTVMAVTHSCWSCWVCSGSGRVARQPQPSLCLSPATSATVCRDDAPALTKTESSPCS
jgi:hypothetical protein